MKTEPINRKLISFDWAIKRLLRNKADFAILEGFLSELFEKDVLIVEILESETNKTSADDKQTIVDMLCKTDGEELVIIEMQFNREQDYFQRMLYGTSKVLTERMHAGKPYEDIVKVYSINMVYFDLGAGTDYVYHGKMIFEGKYSQDNLMLSVAQQRKFERKNYQVKAPANLFPEYYILKINNFNDVAKTTLDEWIYYFKNSTLPKDFTAKGLSLVAERLKEDSMNVEELKSYKKYKDIVALNKSAMESSFYEGEVKGEIKGEITGEIKGAIKSKTETILNGFEMGLSIHDISKLVSMPEDKVIEILKANELI